MTCRTTCAGPRNSRAPAKRGLDPSTRGGNGASAFATTTKICRLTRRCFNRSLSRFRRLGSPLEPVRALPSLLVFFVADAGGFARKVAEVKQAAAPDDAAGRDLDLVEPGA